jgi:antitoxin component HigA of HigAB toxin-antitoxin module
MDLIANYMLEWENEFDPWAKQTPTPRDVLASLMQDRQLTQVQLEQAGVIAQSTLSQVLNGQRGISKQAAKQLASFFDVPIKIFL